MRTLGVIRSCRYSFELKRIDEAIFTKPTVDVFGRRLAVVPAAQLLALESNMLEPKEVAAHAARLRAQLEQAVTANCESTHHTVGSTKSVLEAAGTTTMGESA